MLLFCLCLLVFLESQLIYGSNHVYRMNDLESAHFDFLSLPKYFRDVISLVDERDQKTLDALLADFEGQMKLLYNHGQDIKFTKDKSKIYAQADEVIAKMNNIIDKLEDLRAQNPTGIHFPSWKENKEISSLISSCQLHINSSDHLRHLRNDLDALLARFEYVQDTKHHIPIYLKEDLVLCQIDIRKLKIFIEEAEKNQGSENKNRHSFQTLVEKKPHIKARAMKACIEAKKAILENLMAAGGSNLDRKRVINDMARVIEIAFQSSSNSDREERFTNSLTGLDFESNELKGCSRETLSRALFDSKTRGLTSDRARVIDRYSRALAQLYMTSVQEGYPGYDRIADLLTKVREATCQVVPVDLKNELEIKTDDMYKFNLITDFRHNLLSWKHQESLYYKYLRILYIGSTLSKENRNRINSSINQFKMLYLYTYKDEKCFGEMFLKRDVRGIRTRLMSIEYLVASLEIPPVGMSLRDPSSHLTMLELGKLIENLDSVANKTKSLIMRLFLKSMRRGPNGEHNEPNQYNVLMDRLCDLLHDTVNGVFSNTLDYGMTMTKDKCIKAQDSINQLSLLNAKLEEWITNGFPEAALDSVQRAFPPVSISKEGEHNQSDSSDIKSYLDSETGPMSIMICVKPPRPEPRPKSSTVALNGLEPYQSDKESFPVDETTVISVSKPTERKFKEQDKNQTGNRQVKKPSESWFKKNQTLVFILIGGGSGLTIVVIILIIVSKERQARQKSTTSIASISNSSSTLKKN